MGCRPPSLPAKGQVTELRYVGMGTYNVLEVDHDAVVSGDVQPVEELPFAVGVVNHP